MKYITVFDTSLATDNLGDEIIMEAVMRELRHFYPADFFIRIATHDRIGSASRAFARKSHAAFVGGTNLLCANWFYRRQWQIGLTDFWRIGHPVLMGVGWYFYQRQTDIPTAHMLNYLLSKTYIHSVRDNYTLKRLNDVGIHNAMNTGCPTMWQLTPAHCTTIPTRRAEHALITVTGYRSEPNIDRAWIDLVLSKYKKVYFWPQMYGDLAYMQQLAHHRVEMVAPNLAAYDAILASLDIDFIGTRLHGGIRALQHGRRAMVIEIDNRAAEIARDTGLPTIQRGDTAGLAHWIDAAAPTILTLPWQQIAEWKAQFKPMLAEAGA